MGEEKDSIREERRGEEGVTWGRALIVGRSDTKPRNVGQVGTRTM